MAIEISDHADRHMSNTLGLNFDHLTSQLAALEGRNRETLRHLRAVRICVQHDSDAVIVHECGMASAGSVAEIVLLAQDTVSRLVRCAGSAGSAMVAEAQALRAGALALADGRHVEHAEMVAARELERVGHAAYGAWGSATYYPCTFVEGGM